MAVRVSTVFAFCLSTASCIAVEPKQQKQEPTLGTAITFKNPSICNGYAWSTPLTVVRDNKKITKTPLKFGECRTFPINLNLGDTFHFETEGRELGKFHATELPDFEAALFLLAYRKEEANDDIAFRSHAFEPSEKAQVAVVDVFRGDAFALMKVLDDTDSATTLLSAPTLVANTVTTLTPGDYTVWLVKPNLMMNVDKITSVKLHTKEKGVYVVMRAGNDNRGLTTGDQTPMEQSLYVYEGGAVTETVEEEKPDEKPEENKPDEKVLAEAEAFAVPMARFSAFAAVVIALTYAL